MAALSETLWDVVICGTGLQQSLLALALSRSDKKILHIDPHDYYGGSEAALSLNEAQAWVAQVSAENGLFRVATIAQAEGDVGLAPSRSYSLALAPTLIHGRSALLSQLLSSRAYRQLEFLAVGSFFIFKSAPQPALVRIPSTREDVFATAAIQARTKRQLMKFLKFAMASDSSPQTETWEPQADAPLVDFLHKEFSMDPELQTYIVTLTLSLDGAITTRDGLAAIRRHLSSMGMFGPGFAALYPKWGGLSEVAQVSCRAGAVGGGVYMLGTGIESIQPGGSEVQVRLTSGDTIKSRHVVRNDDKPASEGSGFTRVASIVGSALKSLFEPAVEGAQIPAVAVVAFPARSLSTAEGKASEHPVYLSVHSSDTGECPVNQTIVYLTTPTTSDSKQFLDRALASFLSSVAQDQTPPAVLFKLCYEHLQPSPKVHVDGMLVDLPPPPISLAFDDLALESVKQVWKHVLGDAAIDSEYMIFPDREGVADDDEVYD